MSPRKPTHGGKRKGAGRPASTAASATRPVSFRLGAEDYDLLLVASIGTGMSPGQICARLVRRELKRARRRGLGQNATLTTGRA